jgi:hypothetical protein
MDPYRLFVYREDGQLIGPGIVIHAADDAHAIAQAEIVRGPTLPSYWMLRACGSSNTYRVMAKRSSAE